VHYFPLFFIIHYNLYRLNIVCEKLFRIMNIFFIVWRFTWFSLAWPHRLPPCLISSMSDRDFVRIGEGFQLSIDGGSTSTYLYCRNYGEEGVLYFTHIVYSCIYSVAVYFLYVRHWWATRERNIVAKVGHSRLWKVTGCFASPGEIEEFRGSHSCSR
jgi:hypothetical protein